MQTIETMSVRKRYRRYKTRCIGYQWGYMKFREWYAAWGKQTPGKYGYA